MRQLIKIISICLIVNLHMPSAYSAISGGIDYRIPIDYSVLNQTELANKADKCYNEALLHNNGKLNDNITEGLNLYTMLTNKNPDNINYTLRLGKLYEIIGKNRQAKGCYYRAQNINPKSPEPYYYLGEYYFKREQYRKSLKMYLRASENGYSNHAKTTEKIGTLRRILGDM